MIEFTCQRVPITNVLLLLLLMNECEVNIDTVHEFY